VAGAGTERRRPPYLRQRTESGAADLPRPVSCTVEFARQAVPACRLCGRACGTSQYFAVERDASPRLSRKHRKPCTPAGAIARVLPSAPKPAIHALRRQLGGELCPLKTRSARTQPATAWWTPTRSIAVSIATIPAAAPRSPVTAITPNARLARANRRCTPDGLPQPPAVRPRREFDAVPARAVSRFPHKNTPPGQP
jgi:hypothetical protein